MIIRIVNKANLQKMTININLYVYDDDMTSFHYKNK